MFFTLIDDHPVIKDFKNRIASAMDIVLVSSAIDRGLEPHIRSNQSL
jgi:cell fate (sporulation/competence/biofilm development) regulator YmcA (YheA/YmcA/DUF963 family)